MKHARAISPQNHRARFLANEIRIRQLAAREHFRNRAPNLGRAQILQNREVQESIINPRTPAQRVSPLRKKACSASPPASLAHPSPANCLREIPRALRSARIRATRATPTPNIARAPAIVDTYRTHVATPRHRGQLLRRPQTIEPLRRQSARATHRRTESSHREALRPPPLDLSPTPAPPQNHFHRRWAKLRSLRRPHSIHHRRRRSPPPAQSHLRPSQKPIAPRSQSPRERAPPSQRALAATTNSVAISICVQTHHERAANSVQHAPRPQQDSRTQHSSFSWRNSGSSLTCPSC